MSTEQQAPSRALPVVAGTLIQVAVNFLLVPALSLSVPARQAGIAGLYVATSALCAIALGLGVSGSVTRRYFFEETGPPAARRLAYRATRNLVLVAAVLLTGMIVAPVFAALSVAASLAGTQILASLVLCSARGWRYLALQATSTAFPPLLGLAAVRLIEPTASWFVGAQAAGALLACALWCWILRAGRVAGDTGYDLRFGLPLVIHGIALVGLSSGDRFIVSALRGPSELAVYQLAYALGSITPPILNAWNNFAAPRLYRRYSSGDADALAHTCNQTNRLASVTVAANLVLCVPAVVWFGSGQYDATIMLKVSLLTCLSGLAYAAYLNSIHTYFIGEGSSSLVVRTPVALLAALGLSAVLTSVLGLSGAALASVGGYATLVIATRIRPPGPRAPISAAVMVVWAAVGTAALIAYSVLPQRL